MMALRDATTAKGHADALADDTANKATLIAALEEAIVEAAEQIKTAIEMIRDGVPWSTPSLRRSSVTTRISRCLLPTMARWWRWRSAARSARWRRATGPEMRVAALADAAPTGDDAMNVVMMVMMNDHTGKTWEEIVGSANVKDMRIATTDVAEVTQPVRAASFDGMTFTPANGVPTGMEDNGKQIAASYMGIGGTAFCVGDDCRVDEGDADGTRKVTGSWYFTPGMPMAYYLGTTMKKPVRRMCWRLNYAQFGHWLTVDRCRRSDRPHLRHGGVATPTRQPRTWEITDMLLDKSATYEGTAAGMSLHKDVDGNGDPVPGTLESGAFTADVTLTATFGIVSDARRPHQRLRRGRGRPGLEGHASWKLRSRTPRWETATAWWA